MRYIKEFGIIVFISFTGELFHYFVPLPIPASIYGLVIMLICLITGIIKIKNIKAVSDFLIETMPLMFIPAAVGLMTSWESIKIKLVPYIIIITVVLVIVMVVSGLTSQYIIRRKKRKNINE